MAFTAERGKMGVVMSPSASAVAPSASTTAMLALGQDAARDFDQHGIAHRRPVSFHGKVLRADSPTHDAGAYLCKFASNHKGEA
jgi:hypothetical protein